MPIYSILSAEKGRLAGEDGIYIYADEHDMPAEYEYYPGYKELFGNGLYFIPRRELYKDGLLGNIDEDIPKKIIKLPEKYSLEMDASSFTCKIVPLNSSPKKKGFETKFRFC